MQWLEIVPENTTLYDSYARMSIYVQTEVSRAG